MKTIFLMRHGETDEYDKGITSGQRDPELNMKGIGHVKAAAESLVLLRPNLIISSDLKRALQTASIVSEHLGLPEPAVDCRLRERRWGHFEGKPWEERPLDPFECEKYNVETEDLLTERILSCYEGLAQGTLVVTHAGVIRCILKHLSIDEKAIPPCGVLSV